MSLQSEDSDNEHRANKALFAVVDAQNEVEEAKHAVAALCRKLGTWTDEARQKLNEARKK